MEVTLEGSNSAETPPPWDGVARGHRLVTGKRAVWRDNHFFFFFFFSSLYVTIICSNYAALLIVTLHCAPYCNRSRLVLIDMAVIFYGVSIRCLILAQKGRCHTVPALQSNLRTCLQQPQSASSLPFVL